MTPFSNRRFLLESTRRLPLEAPWANDLMCALEITALDRYSLTWLTASWMGHTLFSGFRSGKRHRLQDALHSHFKNWLEVLY